MTTAEYEIRESLRKALWQINDTIITHEANQEEEILSKDELSLLDTCKTNLELVLEDR